MVQSYIITALDSVTSKQRRIMELRPTICRSKETDYALYDVGGEDTARCGRPAREGTSESQVDMRTLEEK